MQHPDEGASLEKRRPGWIAILCIFMFLSSGRGLFYQVFINPQVLQSAIISLFWMGFIFVAVGLFNLKAWAYWSFIVLQTILLTIFAIEILLVFWRSSDGSGIHFLEYFRAGIGIAWLVYFASSEVRSAFGIRRAPSKNSAHAGTDAPAE